jgi:hypothetical protein
MVNELTRLVWRKPSYSVNEVNCVEIADLPDGGAAVRDSKDPTGPVLAVPLAQWAAFVGAASRGEFG